MYVCICKGVSQAVVGQAIASGARTVDAVGAATGAGTDCGCCRKTISRELKRSQPSSGECSGCGACSVGERASNGS